MGREDRMEPQRPLDDEPTSVIGVGVVTLVLVASIRAESPGLQ